MRSTPLAILITLAASPAVAHIGHIGGLGGHDHWIALGGIAIAGAIALWGARKKPKDEPQGEVEDAADVDEEEATA